MKNLKEFRFYRGTVFALALFMFLGGAVSGCAQVNHVEDFGKALKMASEKNTYIVLDISASW